MIAGPQKKRTTIAILLTVEGEPADALYVCDGLLDAGFFQDAINKHDQAAGPLRVKEAVARRFDPLLAAAEHAHTLLSFEEPNDRGRTRRKVAENLNEALTPFRDLPPATAEKR